MCGIYAYIKNSKFTDDDKSSFKKRFGTIKHRGPDSTKIKCIEEYNNLSVLMGFHRLSINGFHEFDNQPILKDLIKYEEITSLDEIKIIPEKGLVRSPEKQFIPRKKIQKHIIKRGNYILICNGEIYNVKNLRRNNPRLNLKITSNNDCEIILELYIKLGLEKTLEALDGVFAFVIYDIHKKEIIAARDPIGVRPLYIGFNEKEIHFASEIKCFNEQTDLNVFHVPPGSYNISTINDKNQIITNPGFYWENKSKLINVINNKQISNSILKNLLIEAVRDSFLLTYLSITLIWCNKPIYLCLSGGGFWANWGTSRLHGVVKPLVISTIISTSFHLALTLVPVRCICSPTGTQILLLRAFLKKLLNHSSRWNSNSGAINI